MSSIAVLTSSFSVDDNPHLQTLLHAGIDIVTNPCQRRLTEDEAADLLDRSTIGIIAGLEPLSDRAFCAAPNLRVVSRCGSGLDNVDLAAAHKRNITVFNTPEAPALAVAELTLGLMLAVVRKVAEADRLTRTGQWSRLQGRLLSTCTVGIIGLGKIGRRVAHLCRNFGSRILVHDPGANTSSGQFSVTSMDRLLSDSDIVSLHLPLNEQTYHMFGSREFALMKQGAAIINTARGELINEEALVFALDSGHLSGAGLDVYEVEPYHGPLLQFHNIVLSPHLGSHTVETRRNMEIEAAYNLVRGLRNAGLFQTLEASSDVF